MDILLSLLLLLVAARLAGEIAERGKVPALVGEILAGIALGPSLLGLVSPDAGIGLLAELGIFFVVYEAALELTLADMKRSIREAGVYIALGAFSVPALGGTALGIALGLPFATAVFLGIALAFTALPVSIRILSDLNLIGTNFGRSLIAAALLCDVAGLALVGLLFNLAQSSGVDLPGVLLAVGKFAAFMGLLIFVDRLFRYRHGALGSWLLERMDRFVTRGASFALPFLIALGFAFLADFMGLHFVVGVFFGTLLVSEHVIGERHVSDVRKATSAITMGFLGPVFFAFIGLTFVAASLGDTLLVAAVLLAAVATKLVGGYLGAWWAAWPLRQRLAAGIGMNGRGAMELIVAALGLELGFLDARLFSVLVLTGVVTTLMTPLGLRAVLRPATEPEAEWTLVVPEGKDGANGGG